MARGTSPKSQKKDLAPRRQPKPTRGAKPSPMAESSNGAPTDEEIRRRAYEIYLRRGPGHGADLDDWLAAERELRTGRRSRED